MWEYGGVETDLLSFLPSFFFLLWLYNSLCRVLAFSTNSFHLLLSWTRIFLFGNFSFCIYFLTSSSQRVFVLPIGLFEMGFQECIALTILVSSILSIWPSHPNPCHSYPPQCETGLPDSCPASLLLGNILEYNWRAGRVTARSVHDVSEKRKISWCWQKLCLEHSLRCLSLCKG